MVKIDIVSGFLGAGKTTFIKLLLAYYMRKGEKTVYVVNEFGKEGIDGLLMENEKCAVFELVNGCICCSLKAEFTEVLHDVIQNLKPDRIVFEPSGVFVFADFFEFLKNPRFTGKCEVTKCVCVVDALAFPKIFQAATYFIVNQTENADIVFLSKVQLPGAVVEDTVLDVKNINPRVSVVDVPFEHLTDERLDDIFSSVFFDAAHKSGESSRTVLPKEGVKKLALSGRTHSLRAIKAAKPKKAHEDYETMSLEPAEFETTAALSAFAEKINAGEYGNVIRGKGFLNAGGETYFVNMVAGVLTVEAYGQPMDSRLTIIGKDLAEI